MPFALIHTRLHRAEGALGNARHGYARAGEPMPDGSLDEELNAITRRVEARTDRARAGEATGREGVLGRPREPDRA